MAGPKTIPVARPLFGGNEIRFVSDAVGAGEISGNFGRYISRFEGEFSQYCGVQHGISTNNGTTALHVAVAALGIGPGDEVLVQTFTNMATVFAVCYTGARPVPIDVEPDTWNLSPRLLEARINARTKAIIVVHLFGHPVDMDPVLDIARRHGLFVVEDAAQAHGAEYKGKRVGGLGDIACFSFYANKIITTGEGGMVVTDTSALADRVRSLHSLAYGPATNRFMHEAVGFNYRMPNVLAALGCAQLENIDQVIEMKRKMAEVYRRGFGDLAMVQLPVEKEYAKSVYWMYQIVLGGAWTGRRHEITTALKEKGIETRDGFVPFNQQEIFLQSGLVREADCPVANHVAANALYLPSGPVFHSHEQEYVIDVVRDLLSKA